MVESYEGLKNELFKVARNYQQEGKYAQSGKIQELSNRLEEIARQANPRVINCPKVLKSLSVEIQRYVAEASTSRGQMRIDVGYSGEIRLAKWEDVFKNDEGKKSQNFQTTQYDVLRANGQTFDLIDISTSMALKREGRNDGVTEVDKRYVKEIYTPRGLYMQGTEAKITEEVLSDFDRADINLENTSPNNGYNIFGGYNDNRIQYDYTSCVTRGNGIFDDKNIGICRRREKTKGEEETEYIEPVMFKEMGANLNLSNSFGDLCRIPSHNRDGATQDQIDQFIANAEEKYGGEKGWRELLEAYEYREYPTALREQAAEKCMRMDKHIGREAFANIAVTQRRGNVDYRRQQTQRQIRPQEQYNNQI